MSSWQPLNSSGSRRRQGWSSDGDDAPQASTGVPDKEDLPLTDEERLRRNALDAEVVEDDPAGPSTRVFDADVIQPPPVPRAKNPGRGKGRGPKPRQDRKAPPTARREPVSRGRVILWSTVGVITFMLLVAAFASPNPEDKEKTQATTPAVTTPPAATPEPTQQPATTPTQTEEPAPVTTSPGVVVGPKKTTPVTPEEEEEDKEITIPRPQLDDDPVRIPRPQLDKDDEPIKIPRP